MSERRAWRVGVAATALLSVLLRLRFVVTPITSDEGGYLAVARAWRHGKQLYTQVWVDRPQGALLLYRVYDMLSFGDEDHLRVISVVLGAAAVVGLAVMVAALTGRRESGIIAGILGALLSSAPALEGYSANGELLGGTFSVLCLAVGVCVLVGRLGPRWMFAAGALGAIGFSMKQAGIDGLLALGLWLVVVWVLGVRARREVFGHLWRTTVGAAAVLALLVLHALTLNVSDWWYAMFGYRLDRRSALKGANFDRFWSTWSDAKPLFLPMMVAGAVCAVVVVARRRSLRVAGEKLLLPLWAVCAFATFLSGGQFFHHYWITLTFPVAALCAVLIGAAPWETRWVSVMVAVVFGLVSWGSLVVQTRSEIPVSISGETRPLRAEHVGHWLRNHISDGDTMYAMCAAAHTYAHARVDPPYPYLWFDGVHQARHAQHLLVALFQQHPPTWVAAFDSAAACNGSGEVAAVLDADYQQVATVDGVPIYRHVGEQPHTEPTVDRSTLPADPFAADSIWRRSIPADARTVDISDVTGDPSHRIESVGLDLVTLCSTDPSAPVVNVERGSGWSAQERAVSTGEVLYQRRLAPDACTDVTFNPIGNGLFVLFDPQTGTADLGIGGWRTPGGPLLNSAGDGHTAHGLDVFDGDGTTGYGRASGLPALGGLLRVGELQQGVHHALAVNLPAGMLSREQHFVWPARSADATADITYQGSDPALTMGALLAIPGSVRIDDLHWHTPQGRVLAVAAQRYGWYVVDVLLAPHQVQIGMDVAAARSDLGFDLDPKTGRQSVDTARVDADGLNLDIAQIVSLLHAVPQHP